MALLHQAELHPSKLELLAGWLPGREWFRGNPSDALENIGSFRFDDPDGEVGIETLLVRSGDGPVMQVPLSYRGAPLEGGEQFLIGTMQHSALGERWVYDGVGDPVYLHTAATAALGGGHEAELFVDIDGERVQRTPSAQVSGSGSGEHAVALPQSADIVVRSHGSHTVATTAQIRVVVLRVPGDGGVPDPGLPSTPALHVETLDGSWSGQSGLQTLVIVSSH